MAKISSRSQIEKLPLWGRFKTKLVSKEERERGRGKGKGKGVGRGRGRRRLISCYIEEKDGY